VRVTDSRPKRSPPAVPAVALAAPPGAPAGSSTTTFGVNLEPELAWLLLWLLCLLAIMMFPRWQVIPFDLIWISLALLYGFRLWPNRRALGLIAAAAVTTAAAIGDDAVRHFRFGESLDQVPLLATMFVAMAWQAHRRLAARERAELATEAQRLLTVQRQFLQDASHQLRTPITIALGHAELLARALAGRAEQRDIHVVVGELERLKGLSERLLLVAASQNPDFLSLEPCALELLAIELLRRWQPTAPRHWTLGRCDPALALADRDRLSLALDALVENAVKHTSPGDEITVSVACDPPGRFVRIVVEDGGEGIGDADLPHIFDRFKTISGSRPRGTGLGLALVQAIARGHGGEVYVQSVPGQGSRFELRLPTATEPDWGQPALDQETW
jgi:two-component system OmpR family sensor kinase